MVNYVALFLRNRSRRCVMISSRDFLKSNYFVSEYRWAMNHQNSQRIVSCLPVLYELEVGDLPAELRHFNCLHYNDKEFYKKLEEAIRSKRKNMTLASTESESRALPINDVQHTLLLRISSF